MNSSNQRREDILKQLEEGKISAEEAFKLIKGLPPLEKGDPVYYYEPIWQKSLLTTDRLKSTLQGTVVLFYEEPLMCDELNKLSGLEVILVIPGEGFRKVDNNLFTVEPFSENDYTLLFRELTARDIKVDKVVYCWSEKGDFLQKEILEIQVEMTLFSLIYITKELQKLKQKGEIKLLYLYDSETLQPASGAVGAFNRTVNAERQNYNYSSIWLKDKAIAEAAPLILNELKATEGETEICYEQEKRLVKSYSHIELPSTTTERFLKTGGVYLITGGIGGLGLIFAEEIAKNCKGKVILTGRSELDESKQEKLERLNSYSAEVVYLRADVSKAEELESLLKRIRKDYGKIDGIIHSAGINRDAYLHNKQLDQVEEVISPKVYGTVELDKQTASDGLDFFILFSAMASVIGNAGQADYTYANSFMDYYIDLREMLCQKGERSGKSLAISWPLWREGGMQVDRSIEEQFRRNWGMAPLRTEKGVEALFKGLAWKGSQLLVIEGDGDKIAALLSKEGPKEPSSTDDSGAKEPVITSNLQIDIIEMTSKILNIKSQDLDPEDEFNDYGFDSVSLTTLTNRLNERYNSELTPTVFFEYNTINEFIVHFSESHSTLLQSYYKTHKTNSHGSHKKRSEIILHQEEVTRSHSPEIIRSTLLKMASSILKVKESDIYFEDELDDFGFDSIKLTTLTNLINQEYELELTPAIFFEHSSLEEFSTHLIDKLELKNYSDTLNDLNSAYNLQNELAEIASEILGVKVSEIDPEDELDDYGFDSIKLTQFTNKINSKYGLDLTPALFFEYTTLELAADHLEQEYTELFTDLYGQSCTVSPDIIDTFEEERSKKPPHISKESVLREKEWADSYQNDDIAIIGMHGIFPGSEDPAEFWNNLEKGKDLIKEIPPERWRWQDYLHNGSDKETSRWGGFIDNIDCFDPLFFKISPQEAELMDPQQRLFLQTVWKAIEDAGYSPNSLSGSKTGLFLGLSTNDYSELMVEKGLDIEAQTAIGTQHSIVANRISYLLNLHGPSIPVDTACSSSLVAIHYAVESIKNGSCDLAIAGGVNALLSPRLFISFSKAGMMSPVGRCKTFDDSAGGYVRGEGVGAIILKPMLKALEDKDFIYATIKGSAVNHGGHAKSLTAPNPNAQADLLIEAYSKADIDPATVGYIETHGTGTPLGDPIEINGLKKAFKELYKRWGHEESPRKQCVLGSVKTNIGHLEAAAGIAGLIKLLLAMKHKEIPQTVHFTKQNRYIQLDDSPFHISDRRIPWTRMLDEYGRKIPRRAGISSFGFGGVNAHIVIEEHKFKPDPESQKISKPQIVLISAADKERLREYVEKMLRFIDEYKNRHSIIDQKLLLANIAYTLQMGRSEMDYRLATVATTIDELKLKLTAFLNSEEEVDELKAGSIKSKSHDIHGIFDSDMGKLATELFIKMGNYFGMARAWVQGVEFDWHLLHNDYTPKKVPIPSYPFAKERYWLPESSKSPRTTALHMMLDSNISTLLEQAFSKRFTNDEFYLRDHVFGGKCIVPGAALLEMIRAAGKLATNQEVKRLENIIFSYPIVGRNEGRDAVISLVPDKDGVKYELRGQLDSGAKVVHSEGVIKYSAPSQNYKNIDIESLKKEAIEEISPASFYRSIAEAGIESGRTDQTLKEIYMRKDGVLAKLALHSESKGISDLTLHPSLLDGSFHTVTAWLSSELGESLNAHVLFSLESLEIIAPLEDNCYAYSTRSTDSTEGLKKYNITIYDHAGSPLVVMKNVTYKEVDAATLNKKRVEAVYYKPTWIEQELTAQSLEDRRPVIIFDKDDRFYNSITSDLKFLVTPTSNFEAILQASALENPRIIFFAGCREDDIEKGLVTDLETVFSLTKMLFERRVKKVELIYINTEQNLPADGTLAGLCKTVTAENPNYKYKTLNIAPDRLNPQLVMQELAAMEDIEVRYDAQLRKVKTITEISPAPVNAMPLKKGGLYLITGGTGGLGLLFARYLVERYSANLVLTGRSTLDEKKKGVIDELSSKGARVVYFSSDVSNSQSTAALISKIEQEVGKLNGIIHAAGILNDSYILKKDKKSFRNILTPKIDGTLNLDRATKELSLDLFVLFSSTTAVTGNAGQADYAAANSFLDNFAFYRNSLVESKKRNGQTISINWPLWREGGMQIDEAFEKKLAQTIGMEVLETERGLKAFEDILQMSEAELIVFEGDRTKIRGVLGIDKGPIIKEETKSKPLENSSLDLNEQACKYLRELFAEELKLPAGKIKDEAEFEKYGIDSILIMQLNSAIEKDFAGLPKTLFFEYSTIKQLAAYFAENYGEQLQKMSAIPTGQTTQSSVEPAVQQVKEIAVKSRFLRPNIEERKERVTDVAIIGMDGRFPEAENLEQFWQVLKEGKDCIREIPSSRWNYKEYFDSDKNRKGMSYSKWGGFLKDIDKFEPLFFNISPREAEMMDPQERIFLETAWCCLENAGYTPESLKKSSPVVGVFAGAMWTDYQLYKANSPEFSKSFHPGSYLCYIPNRVSYTFGFTGPSVAMDTACSSSLTALHMACQSIINGECDAALAGGVNTISHPNRYQIYSYLNFASSEGKCRSFGADGDGYVAGEGSGVVLLKRLDIALEDGDYIYGVIKGSAINHGGKVSGLTVPNPNQQAAVISSALKNAGVDPRTISYLEAHGTGTSLGDPIEIRGLSKAYSEHTSDKQYCPIGSSKSNIGHLEAAAGIAQLLKVLLQMRYGKLVPSLHSETLNPNIDFGNSPFYVQHKYEDWKRPTINGTGHPRRAGISSFGAGGSNAHIIIEEYLMPAQIEQPPEEKGYLAILSTKREEQLKVAAANLLKYLKSGPPISLRDICYTLQVGREAMAYRLAIKGSTLEELKKGLDSYLANQKEEELLSGKVSADSTAPDKIDIKKAIEEANLKEIADYWLAGGEVDWPALYDAPQPQRVSLPTYPFKRKSYWVPGETIKEIEPEIKKADTLPPDEGNKEIEETIIDEVAQILKLDKEEIERDKNIEEYGFDSLTIIRLMNQLKKHYGKIPADTVFNNPTVKKMATFLDGHLNIQKPKTPFRQTKKADIPPPDEGVKEIEKTIIKEVSIITKLDESEIELEKDIQEYGFDSLAIIRLMNLLDKHYGKLPADTIFNNPTIKKMALYINSKTKAGIKIGAKKAVSERDGLKTDNIFINGVTGLVGGRLIKSLLEKTESKIYCLVRASNDKEGKERIKKIFSVFDPENRLDAQFENRIIPVIGDITKPDLGLHQQLYDELTGKIDLIIHNAGKISLHGLYDEVKAVNVDGTQHMVDFALKTKQKYILFVSTYAVMGDRMGKPSKIFFEKDYDLKQEFENIGYAQSKFEAEGVIRRAQEQGLKWIIVRPGNIYGDSKMGHYPFKITKLKGIYYDLFKTAVELNYMIDIPYYFDMTPVDYITDSIVYFTTSLKKLYETYHLVNPDLKYFNEITTLLIDYGYPIDIISPAEFIKRVKSDSCDYYSATTELIKFNPDGFEVGSYADAQYTKEVLAKGNIVCPKVDLSLIKVYLDYCIHEGYLPKPAERVVEKHQRFEDKVILITGGNSGIGKATARAFIREGARVAICARRAKEAEVLLKEIALLKGEAIFIKTDVTRAEDVQKAIKETVDRFGKLDFAFNNAGIGGQIVSLDRCPKEEWDKVININVTGVWLCMKYEIEEMLKQGGGLIINTASLKSEIADTYGAAYTASKHSVMGLTKAAALEYASKGIRVTALSPGFTPTPMLANEEIVEQVDDVKGLVDSIEALHPIGRMGTPEEMAEAVMMLCNSKASFITGSSLLADGGYTAQ